MAWLQQLLGNILSCILPADKIPNWTSFTSSTTQFRNIRSLLSGCYLATPPTATAGKNNIRMQPRTKSAATALLRVANLKVGGHLKQWQLVRGRCCQGSVLKGNRYENMWSPSCSTQIPWQALSKKKQLGYWSLRRWVTRAEQIPNLTKAHACCYSYHTVHKEQVLSIQVKRAGWAHLIELSCREPQVINIFLNKLRVFMENCREAFMVPMNSRSSTH